MEEKEQVLQARIEALQADNDFTNERLAALQGTDAQARMHTQTHTRGRGGSPSCFSQLSNPRAV